MTTPRHDRRAQALAAASMALAMLAGAASPAHALDAAQVYAKVQGAIWRVQGQSPEGQVLGQGSGVLIAPGRLITNCHVLQRARKVVVLRDDRPTPQPARLTLWDPQRDLCQLEAAGVDGPALTLVPSASVAVGQTAFAIGHPKALSLTMSQGLVSSLRRNQAQQLVLLQTSAAISGGSSGGGLFNDRGELLGITTIGSITADAQNLNFAVPADWISDLPRRHAKLRAAEAAADGRRTIPTPPQPGSSAAR